MLKEDWDLCSAYRIALDAERWACCLEICMGGFMRENNMLWMPLLFFSVKRMFSSIILFPCLSPSDLPNLPFSTSYARPWFCASFLGCERNSCRSSILRHFRVYVTAGSHVIFLVNWHRHVHTHFRIFKSVLDFQSKKQNRAEFNVHKRNILHI
jgi:hypothetical protein